MQRSTPPAQRAEALLRDLVAALPGGGEAREGQVRMARLVAEALSGKSRLAVRAGTGTGKSLAVLAAVATSGARTVIATATRALQDQYVDKELPFVAAALAGRVDGGGNGDEPFGWAVLKGRANYACNARLADARSMLGSTLEGTAGESAGLQLDAVLEWAEHTATGDLSELPFEIAPETFPWVATGPDGCPGAELCAHSDGCFSEAATARARMARVVVVNTALLGADLSVDGALVGDADAYVVDEAHEAEDILAAAFGAEVGPEDLLRLEGLVRPGLRGADEIRSALRSAARALGSALEGARDHAYREGIGAGGDTEGLEAALAEAAGAVAEVQRRAREALRSSPTDARAEACRRSADRLFDTLGRLAAPGRDDAIWVDGDPPRLRRVPIDVAGLLAERAWGDRAVVLTSASVTRWLPGRVGIGGEDCFEDVGSPFDHREAAWLYVPRLLARVPARDRNPNHPDWFEEAWTEAAAVIDAAEGRTMVLCTSLRNATAMAERAREELPWPVLVQNEQPKPRLLAEFADDEHAVLFGTMGLWQGVDVAGPSLSCVIIDKIPFPRPDDPLWQARADHARRRLVAAGVAESDAGYRAFLEVQVPRAAALLAQGSGRLVRSATDRGLVVVLDPRLAEKAYRARILEEMPPMRRTRTRAEAIAHLRTALP
jgi:ATP-dependent DNA helicase DinG